MKRFILAAAGLLMLAGHLEAREIKVATWNIENLRVGAGGRDTEDFERLQRYVARLDADVIALQEVDGPEAAAQVFDPNAYDFFFSRRDNAQRTGFAVRKGLAVVQHPDLTTLNTTGGLRHGTDITVTFEGKSLRLLSVHLKSGCFANPLPEPVAAGGSSCEKLASQVQPLEDWIDARALEDVPFAVLGDFNRRLNRVEDDFWPLIDDGQPANSDLYRATEGIGSRCWDFTEFIDHLVFDRRAAAFVVPDSFQQIIYDETSEFMSVLSDHCPLAVAVNLGAEDEPMTKEMLLQRITILEQELGKLREDIQRLPN